MTDERLSTGATDGDGPAPQRPEEKKSGEIEIEKKKTKKRRRHWPALLVRLPRLFWHPSADEAWDDDWPVVLEEQLERYPALADDLAVWLRQVEPRFRRLDHRAQILQNQFWLQRVTLILGGLVATSLATVQAAIGGGVTLLATVQAVLTGLLAGLTVLIRSRRVQQGYLTARLKSERIKSEFFLFLARTDGYAQDGDQVARLLRAVGDIEAAEGIT
jgi:hypothetical protein